MIGDIITVKPHHLKPAQTIVELTKKLCEETHGVFAFTVGGESGSGKSTLSLAIKEVLEEKGLNCFIFHIDDYFKLPPKDNHEQRVQDIGHVGPGEVKLDLLQEHLDSVKEGIPVLKKPLVHYRENVVRDVMVELKDIDIVIAEGTYSTLLNRIDCKVFLQRTYRDTYDDRVKRARDPIISFNEEVLKIEHKIVKQHAKMADLLVDKEYNVKAQSGKFN